MPVSSSDSSCRNSACIDPEAPCVNDDYVTVDMLENCDNVLGIGNGVCDYENNKEECGKSFVNMLFCSMALSLTLHFSPVFVRTYLA